MTTTTVIMLISIFVIVYICTVHALGKTEFSDSKFVLAFPIAILCVLGFFRGGNIQGNSILNFIMIPYETLAYTFLIMMILLIVFLFRSQIPKMLGRWQARLESEKDDVAKKRQTQTKRLKEH